MLVRNQKTKRWSIDGQNFLIEPNNELGNSSTYFWKKGMPKPELATADEAIFKIRFKKNQNQMFILS
jgi:hypothetical protein